MNPELLQWLAATNRDPLAWVMGAFPWGEPGTVLESFDGPDEWQRTILNQIRDGLPLNEAVKLAIASGHGIGKSACVAWIILWGFTTCPDCRGRVTAGTETQLKTITWAEVGKWFNLCFWMKDHFQMTATALLSRDPSRERTWRIDMVPWSETNPQAFAGMHNQGRRIIYIFDEGSAIADIIFETAEGALTDSNTEIIFCTFGNPTQSTGRFREIFPGGKFHKGWKCRHIDSRDVKITDKKDIERKIELYGEDSDYVRIRIKGQFPRTGEMEFISAADVDAAMSRQATSGLTDALALGWDVARYGANETVGALRKGRDARTLEWVYLRGADTVEQASRITTLYHAFRVDGIFIDGGGIGGGVVDNVRHQHLYCYDVQFGGKDDVGGQVWGIDGERYANKRAAMWGAMRRWLKGGAIPNDPELRAQLIGPKYSFNLRNEIVLESKEEMMRRGVESPDRADALALTFAYPLSAHARAGGGHSIGPVVQSEYDPYAQERMSA